MNKILEFEYKGWKYDIRIKDPAINGEKGKIGVQVTDRSNNELIVNMAAPCALLDYVIGQHGGSRESWMRDAAISEAKYRIDASRKSN